MTTQNAESQGNRVDIYWLATKTPQNFYGEKDSRHLYTIAQRALHFSRWRRELNAREHLGDLDGSSPAANVKVGGSQQGVLVSPRTSEADDRRASASSSIRLYHPSAEFGRPVSQA